MTTTSLRPPNLLSRLLGRPFSWDDVFERLIWLLPLLTILALLISASLSLRNTIERDEALYLQNGRELAIEVLGGQATDRSASTYFSGMPYLYPLMAGLLDIFGGLYLVRAMSLLFMIIALACVYYIAHEIFDRNTANLAIALFASQPGIIFVSHYATYDSMTIMWLALATVFALRAGRSGRFSALALTGLLLFLAVATKYAAVLWVPIVLFVLLWEARKRAGLHDALIGLCVVGIVFFLAWPIWLILDPGLWQGLTFTTTARTIVAPADRVVMAVDVLAQIGITALLGLLGVLLLDWKVIPLALVLWGAGFLAPAYHIYKAESVSMQKHLAYGMVFVAPLAGHALARITGYNPRKLFRLRAWVALMLCLLVFSYGFTRARGFFSWNSAEPAVTAMRTQIRPGETRILTDEFEILFYDLYDLAPRPQWTGLFYFEYHKDGQAYFGDDAYFRGLDDGFFDIVAFGFDRVDGTVALRDRIYQYLEQSPRYELIYELPNWYWGRRDMLIWRRVETTRNP